MGSGERAVGGIKRNVDDKTLQVSCCHQPFVAEDGSLDTFDNQTSVPADVFGCVHIHLLETRQFVKESDCFLTHVSVHLDHEGDKVATDPISAKIP